MSKRLVIIQPGQTTDVPFDQQLTIGRDVYNSLSLQDVDLSRSHAILFEQDDRTIVKDLKSRNGVYVSGEKISEQEIHNGDEVTMGSTIFIFNPPDGTDPRELLTERGKAMLEEKEQKKGKAKIRYVYPQDKMDRVVERLLNQDQVGTNFFTVSDGLDLLSAFHSMGLQTETAELCRVALKWSMAMAGGDRGTIIEVDDSMSKFKPRARIIPNEDQKQFEIPQEVLQLVVRDRNCIFCPDVSLDDRFKSLATREHRKVKSFVAAPLVSGENFFGFIYLDSDDPNFEYDTIGLRAIYFIGTHLAALLLPRETRFGHGANQ